ncbi:NCA2-domain-containing protein [Aspergillus heteromorphus CBS 117.55]|uniref:NCA2-domain-containing protein n=1 Tax=Aspergillus heteromorphus CBS 117.55 TaxID=1448321 RepID=A0A317UYY7_9EURO|nr:NCA2-domain-containing protein [Aspergillus heteromorphus CBS 117.55]PWY66411.1 NCA2-domain-containing protein [Aspergillus heteromorphus CBS 117.55]
MYVINKVYHLDTQLHKLEQRIKNNIHLEPSDLHKGSDQVSCLMKNISILENIIDLLSTTSKSRPLLRADQLARIISEYPHNLHNVKQASSDVYVPMTAMVDYSWMVAAKAAIQTFGIILNSFSEDALALNDEIIYWDSVLESDWYLGWYALQTSPGFLWKRLGYSFSGQHNADSDDKPLVPISHRWAQFYKSVRECIVSQRMFSLRKRIPSPTSLAKREVRRSRKSLTVVKDIYASGIGLLMRKCFMFESDSDSTGDNDLITSNKEWQDVIIESVILMKSVLERGVNGIVVSDVQNDTVAAIETEASKMRMHYCNIPSSQQPKVVIQHLGHILEELLPCSATASTSVIRDFGRPGVFVRYWLPISLAVFSTSTLLELLTNRRHEILRWITDIGSTTIEFWNNWVVDPFRKLIGTIRHDEESEIALMSRNSLEADRASLERMVMDFVLDRCEPVKEEFGPVNTHTITAKVREGDLTPVLKAYEKDLRNPFVGTVRGDLVRALLIQIQKTKVDVEIAIGGIDALLKSQELVFGFVGLTPGIMVSYTTFCWLHGILGNRKGLSMGRRQDELRHALRTIHRTLVLSPQATGVLTFKAYGLLICNAEILLYKAQAILSGTDMHLFQEDIRDLIQGNRIDQQVKIVERMSWMYSRWI